MSTVELYLLITGNDFDPDVISHTLQVVATSSHKKGAPSQYNKNPRFSKWCLSSGKIDSERPDFYQISKSLVDTLKDKTDLIVDLKNRYELEITFQCAVKIIEANTFPIIGFDPYVINFVSRIGASIDIDIHGN